MPGIEDKHRVAVWIDHRGAVIVRMSPEAEEVLRIPSRVEKQPRRRDQPLHGIAPGSQVNPEDDHRERWFSQHLLAYYDKVADALGSPTRVLILGPGEAKGELKARIEKRPGIQPVITLEAAGRMTERQLVRHVSDEFYPGLPHLRHETTESAVED